MKTNKPQDCTSQPHQQSPRHRCCRRPAGNSVCRVPRAPAPSCARYTLSDHLNANRPTGLMHHHHAVAAASTSGVIPAVGQEIP